MKILRQYFFNAVFPAITVFAVALIKTPSDCGQCVGLSFVGSGLMFMLMALLGVSYFLMFIKLHERTTKFVVGLIATFSPTILLAIVLVKNYYHAEKYLNSDFEIASPAIISAFFVSLWTFVLYVKNKPDEITPTDQAGS